MKNKYEKLDQMILNKIGGHPVPFHKIYTRDVVLIHDYSSFVKKALLKTSQVKGGCAYEYSFL